MKSVLLSTPSKRCENIVSGKETIEARKTIPSIPTPFKVYVYCTKGKPFIQKIRFGDIAISHTQISKNLFNGKVIGEFVCDKIEVLFNTNGNPENYMSDILPNILQNTALSFKKFQDYVESRADKNNIRGLHISQLKIYDKPKELSEFSRPCSYDGICFSCKRFKANGSSYDICNSEITRPPRDWMYVEELEE